MKQSLKTLLWLGVFFAKNRLDTHTGSNLSESTSDPERLSAMSVTEDFCQTAQIAHNLE